MIWKKTFFLSFLALLLTIFLHFLYEWWSNSLFALFTPVNESVFEHMKLISTSILLLAFFESIYFFYKKETRNNFLFSKSISAIIGIPLFLLLYLPIQQYSHLVLHVTLLFFVLFLMEFLSFFIQSKKNIPFQEGISLILIFLLYLMFGYFTYHPPKNNLFYDSKHQQYGIHTYQLLPQYTKKELL